MRSASNLLAVPTPRAATVAGAMLGLAVLLAAAPASADEGFTLPDAQPLADGATAAAEGLAADAVATHQGNVHDASLAIAKLQRLVLGTSHAEGIVRNTSAFAAGSLGTGAAVAGGALTFAGDEAGRKLAEAGGAVDDTEAVAAAAVDSAALVTFRAVELTCAAGPVVDLGNPAAPTCTEDSLVGRSAALATGLAGQVARAGDEDLQQVRTALNGFAGGLIGGAPPL